MTRKRRASIETELGTEIQCSRCMEFWPMDSEFFYFSRGKPQSWCKACYVNDPKQIAKVQRANAKAAAKRRSEETAMQATTFNLAAIQQRNPARHALAADVEAFLAKGGQIHRGSGPDPLEPRASDSLPQELTISKKRSRQAWTDERLQFVIENYPTMDTAELARKVGLGVQSLRVKASQLGLKKRRSVQ